MTAAQRPVQASCSLLLCGSQHECWVAPWKTITFVAALQLCGLTAPMVLDGPMNGPAFLAYVEQVLAPTLRPGQIVIMARTNELGFWYA